MMESWIFDRAAETLTPDFKRISIAQQTLYLRGYFLMAISNSRSNSQFRSITDWFRSNCTGARMNILMMSLIVATFLGTPAIAKIGGGKNAKHGKGIEAVQHLYQKATEAYSKPVSSKKDRLKQAAKLRNIIKAIGKKAKGENHSQKAKS